MQNMKKLLKQAEVLAVEKRPEACLGCGFENNCSLHGCAVINTLVRTVRENASVIAVYEAVGPNREDVEATINALGKIDFSRIWETFDRVIKWILENANEEKDNAPLTMEELREMDGKPVWVQSHIFPKDCGYRVIQRAEILFVDFTDGRRLSLMDYDKLWLAYRRKPEEGVS